MLEMSIWKCSNLITNFLAIVKNNHSQTRLLRSLGYNEQIPSTFFIPNNHLMCLLWTKSPYSNIMMTLTEDQKYPINKENIHYVSSTVFVTQITVEFNNYGHSFSSNFAQVAPLCQHWICLSCSSRCLHGLANQASSSTCWASDW